MGGDDTDSDRPGAGLPDRLTNGLRWVYGVFQGFSWSRHLDQPDQGDEPKK